MAFELVNGRLLQKRASGACTPIELLTEVAI